MPAFHDKPIQSKVAIFQHPLHPMVVVFPTAFLLSTVITDALFWWRGDAFWAYASFWLTCAGLCTGLLAAVLGFADFVQLKQVREHTAAWSHFIVAVMALSLAGANVQLRMADPISAVLPWGIVRSSQ